MADTTARIPLREAAYEMGQQALIAQARSLDVEQWQRVGQALAALQRSDRTPAVSAVRGSVLLNLHDVTGSPMEDNAVDLIIDVLWAVHRAMGDTQSVILDAMTIFREEQRRVATGSVPTQPSTGPTTTAHPSADPASVPVAVSASAPQGDAGEPG